MNPNPIFFNNTEQEENNYFPGYMDLDRSAKKIYSIVDVLDQELVRQMYNIKNNELPENNIRIENSSQFFTTKPDISIIDTTVNTYGPLSYEYYNKQKKVEERNGNLYLYHNKTPIVYTIYKDRTGYSQIIINLPLDLFAQEITSEYERTYREGDNMHISLHFDKYITDSHIGFTNSKTPQNAKLLFYRIGARFPSERGVIICQIGQCSGIFTDIKIKPLLDELQKFIARELNYIDEMLFIATIMNYTKNYIFTPTLLDESRIISLIRLHNRDIRTSYISRNNVIHPRDTNNDPLTREKIGYRKAAYEEKIPKGLIRNTILDKNFINYDYDILCGTGNYCSEELIPYIGQRKIEVVLEDKKSEAGNKFLQLLRNKMKEDKEKAEAKGGMQDKYYLKYLKYKQKYLELKNKLKL